MDDRRAAKASGRRKRPGRSVTAGRVVKLARVAVSLAMLAAMTLLFVAAQGWVMRAFGWMPKLQIMPLAMGGAVSLLISWIIFTLIFGRLYCSWFCPMGATQDIFARLARLTRRRRLRHPYRYERARVRTRAGVLIAVAVSVPLGLTAIPSLLDPYSAFGRIGSELLLPAWEWLTGSPVAVAGWMAFGIAVLTLLAVGWCSFRSGRLICNSICPVGTTLGLFSRFSLLHFDIDTDLCVNCRKCEHACKGKCINMDDHVVDGSRCVSCFNCVDACDSNAIRYTTRRKKLSLPLMQRVNQAAAAGNAMTGAGEGGGGTHQTHEASAPLRIDRRQFLATGMILAATPAVEAARKKARRIQALTYGGKAPAPTRYVAPPGRRSMEDFLDKCTGCGLCIARCPAKVLKPSANQFGWLHALHPVMDYSSSYCRYNCTRCTEVCPTGALLPLEEEEKHIFIIGHAQADTSRCIGCGLCAERCPRQAIRMGARRKGEPGQGFMVPRIHTDLCIGCGACEYICPATPVKAIWVNGIV